MIKKGKEDFFFFFFKQKTAYEIYQCDWSSDVCSSDLHERNVEAIQRAGADFVLSYTSLGVQTVYSIVQGRELVVLGEGVDLFYVPLPLSLVDKTLAEAGIGACTGLNVIGVQQDGQIVTDLPPDQRLVEGSTLVALGSAEQWERFGAVYD